MHVNKFEVIYEILDLLGNTLNETSHFVPSYTLHKKWRNTGYSDLDFPVQRHNIRFFNMIHGKLVFWY